MNGAETNDMPVECPRMETLQRLVREIDEAVGDLGHTSRAVRGSILGVLDGGAVTGAEAEDAPNPAGVIDGLRQVRDRLQRENKILCEFQQAVTG